MKMTKQAIRTKIKRFQDASAAHLEKGRPISAEKEQNVADSLTGKLQEIIGGSEK